MKTHLIVAMSFCWRILDLNPLVGIWMWMIYLYVCSNLNMLKGFFNNFRSSVPKNIKQLFIDFKKFWEDNFKFDFLAFAETRLNPNIEQLYRMPQYNLIRNSRNTSGGDVCLYIKKT